MPSDYDSALRRFTVELEATTERVALALEKATTDGIATGLSRALVALERRAKDLALLGEQWVLQVQAYEAAACARLVRTLLEALVDGPTDLGEKLAQR